MVGAGKGLDLRREFTVSYFPGPLLKGLRQNTRLKIESNAELDTRRERIELALSGCMPAIAAVVLVVPSPWQWTPSPDHRKFRHTHMDVKGRDRTQATHQKNNALTSSSDHGLWQKKGTCPLPLPFSLPLSWPPFPPLSITLLSFDL